MTRRSGKGRKNGCDSSSAKDECGKVSAEAKNLNINAPDFTPHTHKYSVQSKYAQSLMGQHVE